ncbi:MAG: glycosyltransferase family 2 protein, partial [Candidatus Adiutrix sp.]
MAKINVIVPLRNQGATLRKFLNSIKEQTFSGFQVQLIDSASEDETEFICRKYAKGDARFKYKRFDKAINFRLAYMMALHRGSDCEFFILGNSSFSWAPDYLNELMGLLLDHPEAIAA